MTRYQFTLDELRAAVALAEQTSDQMATEFRLALAQAEEWFKMMPVGAGSTGFTLNGDRYRIWRREPGAEVRRMIDIIDESKGADI